MSLVATSETLVFAVNISLESVFLIWQAELATAVKPLEKSIERHHGRLITDIAAKGGINKKIFY